VIRDANQVAEGRTIRADVCIVGAGPAGLTVADRLRGSGLDVVVLESGGDEWDERTQALADGTLTGEPFRFNGTEVTPATSRLRQLGGTSNHWTGQCRPLDPHDFERRDAVAHSGWPIGFDDLAPYYRRAAASCDLATDEWDASWWSTNTSMPLLTHDDPVRTVVFQFSPPTRFGPARRAALASSETVDVYLWANVTSIDTAADGGTVERLQVATLAGRRWSVEADRVVLAVGGIETPRLLLASDGVAPSGVGNGNDLVGRYFMDHPHSIAGRVLFATPPEAWAFYTIGSRPLPDGKAELAWGGLGPSPTEQARAGIANSSVQLWSGLEGPPRDDRDVETGAADAVGQLLRAPASAPTTAVMSVRTEQHPNPDSRVTLGEDRDELGMRRVEVDWQITDADRDTLRRTIEIVGRRLGELGLARVEVDPSGRAIEGWPLEIGNHHMGTTRMAADPADGVVDESCRMHEVDNLYICSSAVFPTSGMANPTLTIVALAHRLADHLRGRSDPS
jgi:choline dehydrogenase-like flavoprotein